MVRQLTAIMFTDLVGYTAMMQADEREAKRARDRQRVVLEQCIERFDGNTLQFYGDGTLSVFQSAVSAVECAIAIQSALNQADRPVPVRIGIHSGDVVHDENGVFGDGVNVASRIEGLGVAGAVLISGKVYDEVKNQTDIKTRSLGSFNLKNIAHETRVYAVSNRGLAIPPEAALRDDRASRSRSIAVLPFVNMSSDPENEFFSDGITEEIINALTRVNGLQVTARTSSFAFKNHNDDIRTIASKLGVTHVLEGSVRRAGNRVRVTAQLISANDGYHLMSEVYDGTLNDIFALQDEMSVQIVEHLAERLGPVPTSGGSVDEHLVHGHSRDTEAYQEYLKGNFEFARFTPPASRKAIEHYERSVQLDPDFGLPYSGMAGAYTFLGAIGHMRADEAYPAAERAAQKALTMEEGRGDAYGALALVRFFYHWDWDGAYRAFQKALSLTPGSADVHQFYSMFLRALNEPDEALKEAEIALRLDPLSSPIRFMYAECLMLVGELEKAEEVLLGLLDDDPDFRTAVEGMGLIKISGGDPMGALPYFEQLPDLAGLIYAGAAGRGFVHALLGNEEEARAMLRLLDERQESDPDVMLELDRSLIHQGLGNFDQAFHHLERAVEARAGGILFLAIESPWLRDEMREDPRHRVLLEKIGHPSVTDTTLGDWA